MGMLVAGTTVAMMPLGCGGAHSQGTSDVFAWIPDNALTVQLVDWAAINDELGVGHAQSVETHVHALLNNPIGALVPSTLYGYDTVLHDLFDWDLRDLVWEMHWANLENSATVVQFTRDTDMRDVEKSFEDNGYQSSSSDSGRVWTRESAAAVGPLPFRSVMVYRAPRVVVLSVDRTISFQPGEMTWNESGLEAPIRSALRHRVMGAVTRMQGCNGPPPLMAPELAPSFNRMRRGDFSVLSFGTFGNRLGAFVTNSYPDEVDAGGQAKAIEDFVRTSRSLTGRARPYWAFMDITGVGVQGQTVRFDIEPTDLRLRAAYGSGSEWPFTLCAA
jgi:hypothetical protein